MSYKQFENLNQYIIYQFLEMYLGELLKDNNWAGEQKLSHEH